MGFVDWIIVAVLAAAVILCVRSVWRARKKGGCSSCSGCSGCSCCGKMKE